jgi:hypothetical protein
MTIAELRHHAWNYNALAEAAERNALYAETEREVDLWNNAVLILLDCAAAFERQAEAMERQAMLPLDLVEVVA